MIQALVRKARHVLEDPVLRLWLARRIVGLEKSPPGFVAGQPPYLGAVAAGSPGRDIRVQDFPVSAFVKPASPERVVLPGQTVELDLGNPTAFFTRSYDDLETSLAAHRFAWVPIAGDAVDPNWVATLWQGWVSRFGSDTSGWPWHAYTAAERAINIIDFSRRFGLPGDPDETRQMLMLHAEVIRDNLEYFGDHYTSNHLSNNGRGLLRIGTVTGRADYADTGVRIMVAEAGRIFGRSGVLREGSTHYHLLVTRNYIDAWLDARAAGLDQAVLLHDIAQRALAVIPGLRLSGGLPLIGDISPDIPPACLGRLFDDSIEEGWPENLPADRQRDALEFIASNIPVSPEKVAEDGWHRFGGHRWQALSFVSTDGWPPMPGHGHADLGSFELHDGIVPIIIDPGRGSYARADDERADAHNGLVIDGAGAMPVNRAYYSTAFRHRIVPSRPKMTRTRHGQVLEYGTFIQGSKVNGVKRSWQFTESAVEISDRVEGHGRHRIHQKFIVPGTVSLAKNRAKIAIGDQTYEISTLVPASSAECTIWRSYGCGDSATAITFDQTVKLPFKGTIKIEKH